MPTFSSPRRVSFVTAIVAAALLTGAATAASGTSRPRSQPGHRSGYAGASGEAGVISGLPARVRLDVGPTLPGIDVSHWQGEIDWARVADRGVRFAFLKATDGHDFVDPTFVANRAGARSNGLAVGAYHFARPDPSKGDAVEEARWFVSHADPGPGTLLPVLDLETSQGLDQRGVTQWARRWVAEVRRLTGVMPLVYTSPYGWMSRTGDSRALAREGSPLWIAHWGVQSPSLPAGEWDGNGWRIWQHTSQGQVAGIAGPVDLDVVQGNSLGPITIRRLRISVAGNAGKVVSAPAGLGCRTTCAKNVDPEATVTLTARPDQEAYFTGWEGACSGEAATCTLTVRGNLTVGATFVTDISPPVGTVDVAGGHRGPVVVRFDEPVRGVGPANVLLREAAGSRTAVTRTCRSSSDRAVDCHGLVRSIVLTPSAPLVPGRDHEVVIDPPGAEPLVDRVGNPAPSSTHPFTAPLSVEQGRAPVTKSPAHAWRVERNARASGGSFAVADRAGAAAALRFDGVGIDVVTVTGPNRGRARVSIDGVPVQVLDLYSAGRSFGVVERFDGLADGAHTLRIEVLGRRSQGSSGRSVAIDRFDVLAA